MTVQSLSIGNIKTALFEWQVFMVIREHMSLLCEFYSTTVGKKIAMALSGLIFVGFVIGHMLGNLKIFLGFDHVHGTYFLDAYGEHLRTFGEEFLGRTTFLWIVRAVLFSSLVIHVTSAIQLSIRNRQAKPAKAAQIRYSSANAASRTMLFGGLFLLCFIVFHILHFTTGQLHFRGFEEGKVYANVYSGFQSLPAAAFYVAAMFFLMLHLYHGIWSMFQTLGVDSPAWNKGIRTAAKIVSVFLFIGFSVVPVGVVAGVIPAPTAPQAVSAHSN